MSEDFLKDPLSLFSVKGKTAVITGATGAFGALAAKVMAGAGAHVVICANNAPALKKVAAECRGELRDHRQRGGRPVQEPRYSCGRVRPEQGGQDRRAEGRGFPRRHG